MDEKVLINSTIYLFHIEMAQIEYGKQLKQVKRYCSTKLKEAEWTNHRVHLWRS